MCTRPRTGAIADDYRARDVVLAFTSQVVCRHSDAFLVRPRARSLSWQHVPDPHGSETATMAEGGRRWNEASTRQQTLVRRPGELVVRLPM